MKPSTQSFSLMRSAMMPTTISSVTKAPESIAALAFFPTSVPAATAARSMSPVESCGMLSLSTIFGACVPLPAPGGPNRIKMFLDLAEYLASAWLVNMLPLDLMLGSEEPLDRQGPMTVGWCAR